MKTTHERMEGTGSGLVPVRASSSSAAFTLIELMVVVGLIATMAAFLFSGRNEAHQTSALQSAQATVANLFAAARMRAVSTGRATRVLVHADPSSTQIPARFLRCLAIQTNVSGRWQTVTTVSLPTGIYVVPGNDKTTPLPAGLIVDPEAPGWKRADGAALRSTVLRDDSSHLTLETIDSGTAERWANVAFTETGTTGQSGDLVLVPGRRRPPGSYAAGEAPVVLNNPQAARGVALSVYGLAALIDRQESF